MYQQQRSSSPPASVGLDSGGRGFQQLPNELLEDIYILSETLSLSHVCRLFYARFSTEPTRLRFCTRVFLFGNPDNLASGVVTSLLKKEASTILSQKWFTYEFARKVEKAVLQIQEEMTFHIEASVQGNKQAIYIQRRCPYTGILFSILGPNKITAANQVYLPARLLYLPVSYEKWELLSLFQRWGVSLRDETITLCHKAIHNAILDNDLDLFHVLLIFRGEIDHELFRLVRSSGCRNSAVEVFLSFVTDHVRRYTTLWRQELCDWVMQDWKGGVGKRNQAGEKPSHDECAVGTGRDEVPEGNCVKAEGNRSLDAQMRRLLRRPKLLIYPGEPQW